MKLGKKLLLTAALVGAGYYIYTKTQEQELDNEHIDDCRNLLIMEGYNVDNSYTLNLKENPYLLFYFTDNEKDYEARYDKENKIVEYIKEV